ncbi:MAG: hypothetical protein V4538_16230 [Bacteroidota bacterium]
MADSTLTSSIVATEGQSIYDLCLMTYGDFKYLYKLMQDNNIIGPNDINLSGKKINFNPILISDIGFFNLIQQKKKINTLNIVSSVISETGLQTDDGINLQTDDGLFIIVD